MKMKIVKDLTSCRAGRCISFVLPFAVLTGILFSACSKTVEKNSSTPPQTVDTSADPGKKKSPSHCVFVFYDRSLDSSYELGSLYAVQMQNLLGHFPDWQSRPQAIENYQKGQLEQCDASIYIGSFYDNPLPRDFLNDFIRTRKSVLWMGYSIWQLNSDFEELFGYRFAGLTHLDDSKPEPSFFKDVIYKGETFSKWGQWNPVTQGVYDAAYEQIRLSPQRSEKSQVLAKARNPKTQEELPWALRAGNHFYIAEVPFSYQHEGDRYFVMADLLFDLLKEPAKRNQHLALVRLEDIHPQTDLDSLRKAVQILRDEGIRPHLSLIPIYKDPFHEAELA